MQSIASLMSLEAHASIIPLLRPNQYPDLPGVMTLNLYLMRNVYLPIDAKFADCRWYYNCFDSYYRDVDATPMVEKIA